MHVEHTYPRARTHTHLENGVYRAVHSPCVYVCAFICFFCFFDFLGLGAPTLSQFKHIQSAADYVCRYYPKESAVRFLKRDADNYGSDNPRVVSQLLQCVYTI